MKERPILFSGPMVRAILEGRKTQTRRIVKDQDRFRSYEERTTDDGCFFITFDGYHGGGGESCTRAMLAERYCPHGKLGDRLWVRETFCQKVDDAGYFIYNADGNLDPTCYHYAADGIHVLKSDGDGGIAYRKDGSEASPWKSSMFMPRFASRILLEIVNVRVERLNEISNEDAETEGVDPSEDRAVGSVGMFSVLWEQIHGDGTWAANPWVWVITFKKV